MPISGGLLLDLHVLAQSSQTLCPERTWALWEGIEVEDLVPQPSPPLGQHQMEPNTDQSGEGLDGGERGSGCLAGDKG